MTRSHSINFRGFEFDFIYTYSPGRRATWQDPEEYEEWEIFAIKLNGIDADELLESYIEEFEQAVIDNITSYNY